MSDSWWPLWFAAHQAPLSFTISWSLLKFLSIESVMLSSNHLILCYPLLLPSIFPSIRVFPMSRLFISGGQSIRASALASVLPKNIQGWFPLGVTGLISLQSKGPSRVFSTSQFKSILPYLILKWPCIIILIVSLSQIKKHLTWDHLVSWEWTGDLNPKLPDLKPMLLSTR